jgi:hypothetical protein
VPPVAVSVPDPPPSSPPHAAAISERPTTAAPTALRRVSLTLDSPFWAAVPSVFGPLVPRRPADHVVYVTLCGIRHSDETLPVNSAGAMSRGRIFSCPYNEAGHRAGTPGSGHADGARPGRRSSNRRPGFLDGSIERTSGAFSAHLVRGSPVRRRRRCSG